MTAISFVPFAPLGCLNFKHIFKWQVPNDSGSTTTTKTTPSICTLCKERAAFDGIVNTHRHTHLPALNPSARLKLLSLTLECKSRDNGSLLLTWQGQLHQSWYTHSSIEYTPCCVCLFFTFSPFHFYIVTPMFSYTAETQLQSSA